MNPVRKFIREITGLAADERINAENKAALDEQVQISLGLASSLSRARQDRDLAHQENRRLNDRVKVQLRQIKDDQGLIGALRSSKESLCELVKEVKLDNANMADEFRSWNRKCEALKEVIDGQGKRIEGLTSLNSRLNADAEKSWNDNREARVLIRELYELACEHLVAETKQAMKDAAIIYDTKD